MRGGGVLVIVVVEVTVGVIVWLTGMVAVVVEVTVVVVYLSIVSRQILTSATFSYCRGEIVGKLEE